MAIIQTEAIVLKTFDFRETSKIANFFSLEEGKVSGVLKGIRKDPKKFGSSLEPFSVNHIVYYRYSNSDLHLISQCDMRSFFLPIRQDLNRALAAHYMAELINRMMPSEMKNQKIYHLMLEFLNTLQATEDIDRLIRLFQIKALLFSGFRPHLDACVSCKKKVAGKARFSMKEGGLVCPHCKVHDQTHPISPGTVATILHAEQAPWNDAQRLRLTKTVRDELKYILNNFLVFHLGKKIRSERYV
jgi:DNA repair protein RecO (recombination protein O)